MTDTKAMSREDALESKFVCPSACDWYKPVIEAMELYKDSCLAAQKAEHEKLITQEKAKAFDEGVTAYKYGSVFSPVNPYRQDK